MVERSAATHSHTLDRGLRALEVLAEHQEGLTVSELAALLDTHRAAVYRLLGPLMDHRLVRRDLEGRAFLASGLLRLAATVRPRVLEVAEPVLQRLSDELAATTALTLREGNQAVVSRVHVPRNRDMHLIYRSGMRHPLAVGAPGFALLSLAPPVAGEPAEVNSARHDGYVVSHDQLLPGATGVAAPVARIAHEPDAAVSAVWITGHEVGDVSSAVVAAASRIGELMGVPAAVSPGRLSPRG